MLYQGNGKNLSMKETIVASEECLKFLGSPVTCGGERVKKYHQEFKKHNKLILKNSKNLMFLLKKLIRLF